MKKRRRTANTTKKRDAIDLSARVGLMHKTCERTHANLGAKCITQRNNIICWHHRSRASQKSSIPAQQIQRTGARKRACRGETGRSLSTKHMRTDESSSTMHTSSQATPPSRHPGTADAVHRHVRAGLQERNGLKITRGARATRPTTSQHRVARQRRSST